MSDEKDKNIIISHIWNGPKIAKYGNKHLGVYDLQISNKEKEYEQIMNTFQEISKILRYNEFRRILSKEEMECYQFIKPISDDEIRSYKQNERNLLISTKDIKNYANARATQQMNSILNQHQVKNRSSRETKWKDWYEKRIEEENEIENRKIDFMNNNVISQELKYGSQLLKFQINHVKNLLACLRNKGVTLDASDTGTGKTYSALCLAKELGLIPIVICPKSIIPGWMKAMKHFKLDEYYVANYEQYRAGNTPYLEKKGDNPEYSEYEDGEKKITSIRSWQRYEYEKNEKKHNENISKIPKMEYIWKLESEKHLLIFDECHKTKNPTTQNYAIYWWAKKEHEKTGLKIISLSATVADKISNAYSICYMLGLTEGGNDFNMKYNIDMDKGMLKDFGYEVTANGFYKFNQKFQKIKDRYQNEDTNLKRLHNDLFPINGSRMVIQDLGDAFPENFVQAQTYDMDKRADEIQNIYKEMEKNLLKIKLQQLQQKNNELLELEQRIAKSIDTKKIIKYDIKSPNNDITFKQKLLKDNDIDITFKQKPLKDNEVAFTFKSKHKKNNTKDITDNTKDSMDNIKDKKEEMIEMIPKDLHRLNELKKEQKEDIVKLSKLQEKLEQYGMSIQPEHLNKSGYGDEKNNLLTIMLRARQKVELLKADTIIELATDFYEQNKSVVIFVNFIETLEYINKQLQHNLRTKQISILKGGQSVKTRQEQLDLFQSDQHRVIIATIGTGKEGINLHDLHGRYPRVSLISPSWSAQDLIQALGRIYRAETKTKCLQYLIYCAGTIEDRICEIIQNKIKTINTINDGDLSSGLAINSLIME